MIEQTNILLHLYYVTYSMVKMIVLTYIFVSPGDAPRNYYAIMMYGSKDNLMLAKPLAARTHLSSTVSELFEPQVQKIAVFAYRSPHFCFL